MASRKIKFLTVAAVFFIWLRISLPQQPVKSRFIKIGRQDRSAPVVKLQDKDRKSGATNPVKAAEVKKHFLMSYIG